jgi:Uma2 family endonuclease
MVMPDVRLPDRLPLTADEFERMPPVEGLRIELSEGNLDVAAAAQMAWHSLVTHEITNCLGTGGRAALAQIGLVLTRRTVREPDVSRFRPGVSPGPRVSQFAAMDVDLVVEVISPESQKRDRLVKPVEYAEAGIPEMWLVDEHPENPMDAMIGVYELGPSQSYKLVRTVALSSLTAESEA